MADTNVIMSVIATTASRLPDLSIKNGQLIFVQDKQKIALDFNDKRKFYNQVVVLQTEQERTSLLAPVAELFYFVVDTAVLWTYQSSWIQVTTSPQDIVFIGVTLPELGSANTLYVDTTNKHISVWDTNTSSYVNVSETTESITDEDILSLFTTT